MPGAHNMSKRPHVFVCDRELLPALRRQASSVPSCTRAAREREREVVYLVVSDESDEGVHVLVVDALAPLSEPEDAHLDRPAMSQHQEVEVEDPYTYEQAGMQDSVLAQVEVRSSGRARTPSQPRPCVARVSWGPGHTSCAAEHSHAVQAASSLGSHRGPETRTHHHHGDRS